MEEKHIIIGTAGHVDHGKTALIKALTGFDCDTHQEEKKRGITINLGFTHLELDEHNSVGIIDVPGHADFINTMISGAAGIDFVLLVIAADEGIMPQTYEHLEIMKLLNISSGFIVLSKVDLVDEDLIELAKEEITEFTKNSFLESAPILPFSKFINNGLQAIKEEIKEQIQKVSHKQREGVFRLYIDRVFSVQGFGTIVNGSALSGRITLQDKLYLYPGDNEIRIRNLQRHGKDVKEIVAGDRSSLNIVGLKKSEFHRGMLLTNQLIAPTDLIDVNITLFKNSKPLTIWSQVIFLLQTYKLMVRVHLLDKDILTAGKNGLAQIYLPQEIICFLGDCFIIRDSSDNFTLGGGEVIDPNPLHHRRRKEEQIEKVKQIAGGEVNKIIENAVRKTLKPALLSEITAQLHLTEKEIEIDSSLAEDIKSYPLENDILFIQKKIDDGLKRKIVVFIKQYHTEFPIFQTGRTLQELGGLLNDKTKSAQLYLTLALQDLLKAGTLKKMENTWALADHKDEFSPQQADKLQKIESMFRHVQGQIVQQQDILNAIPNLTEKEYKMFATYLLSKKRLVKADYYYFHHDFIEIAKEKLISYLEKHGEEGIKVAEYRDLIAGNRKLAMLLLDYFETVKVVENHENIRFLREKRKKK